MNEREIYDYEITISRLQDRLFELENKDKIGFQNLDWELQRKIEKFDHRIRVLEERNMFQGL
jgi:uncharacterized coiled-coil protein SlyX